MTTPRLVRAAGAMLFVAGAVILMGIISAEALYPAPYTTGGNEISDLGGTEPPAAIVLQPSATIFNLTMMTAGVLVLAGAACLQLGLRRWSISLVVAAMGAGASASGSSRATRVASMPFSRC